MLFLLLLLCVCAYPTVEDLIAEDYELIEILTDVKVNGPLLIFESASVKPKEEFRLMFVKMMNFVDFFLNVEQRDSVVLTALRKYDQFTADTLPRFKITKSMQNFKKFETYRLYMCALCDYLNYFETVYASVGIDKKREGDFHNTLQQLEFTQSMKPCAC